MNDMMTLGVHRLWKRFTRELSGVTAGQRVLDVASGTGDLAAAFAARVGNTGSVVATDINNAMLSRGRDALIDRGIVGNVDYVLAKAESLPYPDQHLDCESIDIGQRNVTRITQALAPKQRV